MKTIFIILVSLMFFGNINAQVTEKRVKDRVYVWSDRDGTTYIRNKANASKDTPPKDMCMGEFSYSSRDTLYAIFEKNFGKNRLTAIPNSTSMVEFLINIRGDILEVRFSIGKELKITPMEAYDLEDLMKQKISFSTEGCDEGQYMLIAIIVRTRQVLDYLDSVEKEKKKE